MDTIFTLPLSILAALLTLLALLLLSPRPLSLPLSQALSKARRSPAAQSVFGTVCLLLLGLLISCFSEVYKGADRAHRGDLRVDVMGTIDFLRAQVSCVLCVLNVVLLLTTPALAEGARLLDSQGKNLEAMKRQVKGLQTEYERVTSEPVSSGSKEGAGGQRSEVEEWKAKVDKLIREKAEQQADVDAARKAKNAADAKVDALLSQIKGFDKEYDRVLEENRVLQNKLAQADSAFQALYKPVSKKDD